MTIIGMIFINRCYCTSNYICRLHGVGCSCQHVQNVTYLTGKQMSCFYVAYISSSLLNIINYEHFYSRYSTWKHVLGYIVLADKRMNSEVKKMNSEDKRMDSEDKQVDSDDKQMAPDDKQMAPDDKQMASDDKQMDSDGNVYGPTPQVNNTISCFPGFVLVN